MPSSDQPRAPTLTPIYVGSVVGLAVVYVVTARFGLAIDAVAGFATLVWPATGIALAALVLYGYRLWPGIFIGALVANTLTGAPPLVALGIAVGNTLEAVAGTYMLRQVAGFRPSLDGVRDVLALIVLAAGLGTMLSATIGVSSLYLGGIVPLAQVPVAWRACWSLRKVAASTGNVLPGSTPTEVIGITRRPFRASGGYSTCR